MAIGWPQSAGTGDTGSRPRVVQVSPLMADGDFAVVFCLRCRPQRRWEDGVGAARSSQHAHQFHFRQPLVAEQGTVIPRERIATPGRSWVDRFSGVFFLF